jgi:hypothetical protein
MVQFPGYCSVHLCIQCTVTGLSSSRVTPFGDPRIAGCLLLPVAFRSLPRPSSPDSSEASTMNSCSLDHILSLPLIVFRVAQGPSALAVPRSWRLSLCPLLRHCYMQEPWPFAPVPQIGSLPSGRDPLSKRTLNRLRFVRGANMTHRPPPFGSCLKLSRLRRRTLPFPGLSKIITARAETAPAFHQLFVATTFAYGGAAIIPAL